VSLSKWHLISTNDFIRVYEREKEIEIYTLH